MPSRLTRALITPLALVLLASTPAVASAQAQVQASDAGLLGAARTQAAAPVDVQGAAGQPRIETIRSVESAPQRSAEPHRAAPAAPSVERTRPPAAPTDFQRLVETSTGTLLPIFGQSLFTDAPSTFAPVEGIPATSDYVVGPGDEVVIRGWGQVDIDVRAVVSREGTISIPRVGVVSLSGVRFEDLAARVRAAIGRNYKNFELAVSLGQLRSIQVFVVGQAQRPGLYTVSALSTLMNALFASGGPSSTGTMRHVELRRADVLVGRFDLYDLLLRGDKSRDLRLQSGDVIFIPPVGPLAAIAGMVKTPAVFELADARTTLGDLVGYAGGLTTTAATRSVTLERLEGTRGRVIEELPWDEAARGRALQAGDLVLVKGLSIRFDNAVTLRGNVADPHRMAWRSGLRVSDLIPDRSVLITERYWERSAARARSGAGTGGNGRGADAARSGGRIAQAKVEVENLVDEVNWDYAVVERLDPDTLEARLLPFNLRKAVVAREPAEDLPLQPGDIVTVFSRSDVVAPVEKRTYFVRVEGEVQAPGVYQVAPGATLAQLVALAGGLARNAYLFGAEFTREEVRVEQQRRLDEVITRAEQDLERASAERLARSLSAEDTASTRAQLDVQRTTLARLRALRASGRMVLELSPEASSARELPDLLLADGDRLYIPARSSTVGVFGAVYTQASFIHRPGKTVNDYLAQAGGPTTSADAGSTYVLRADGSVFSRRQAGPFTRFGGRALAPSDAVVVPEEYNPVSFIKELRDWTQIFYQFGLGVAAIKILFP